MSLLNPNGKVDPRVLLMAGLAGGLDNTPPEKPISLEKDDPELADLLKWYCNLPAHIRKRMGGLDTVEAPPKVGRNDPCPCGSGLKYKKCCGKMG